MKSLTFTLMAISIIATTGCHRFREMTRPGYAALTDDPFALDTGDESEAPQPAPVRPGGFDVASLSGSAPKDPTVPSDPSDYSRIMHTAGSQKAGTTDPRLAQIESEADSLFTDFTKEPNTPAPPPNMEEMAAFVRDEAMESGLTETVEMLSKDFAQFRESRQREWDREATRMHAGAIQQVSQTEESFTDLRNEFENELHSSANEFEQVRRKARNNMEAQREALAREFAEPLIPESEGSSGTAPMAGFIKPQPVGSEKAEPLIYEDPNAAVVQKLPQPRTTQSRTSPTRMQTHRSTPVNPLKTLSPPVDLDADPFGDSSGRTAVPLEPPKPTVRRMPPRQVEQQDDSPFARFRTNEQKRTDGFGWQPSGGQ